MLTHISNTPTLFINSIQEYTRSTIETSSNA